MSFKKGVICNYLCINPGCKNSGEFIEDKQALTGTSSKSFKLINSCSKCKASLELINFVSGTLDIKKDNF